MLKKIENLEIQVSRNIQFIDINYKNNEQLKKQLIYKIMNEDASQLEEFLSKNVINLNDTFSIGEFKRGLLHWINGSTEIDCLKLEVLFNNGLKGNSEVNKNNEILWSAITQVNVNLFRHLLNYEIDINKTILVSSEERMLFTPIICSLLFLYSYCKENKMEDIEKSKEIVYWLANHKDIEIDSRSDGPSALCIANRSTNSSELIKFLQDKVATKNERETVEFKETIMSKCLNSLSSNRVEWTV